MSGQQLRELPFVISFACSSFEYIITTYNNGYKIKCDINQNIKGEQDRKYYREYYNSDICSYPIILNTKKDLVNLLFVMFSHEDNTGDDDEDVETIMAIRSITSYNIYKRSVPSYDLKLMKSTLYKFVNLIGKIFE